jgi:hypothetical protein
MPPVGDLKMSYAASNNALAYFIVGAFLNKPL